MQLRTAFDTMLGWLASRLPGLLHGVLGLASLYYLGLFVYIASARAGYRFELEWMEGATLEHVARVVAGKSIYVAPTLEFTPYLYTPLYYWVCAPFTWLFGLELHVLRAVSIAATLGLFGFLYLTVTASTRDRLAGLIAVGSFAATFAIGGAWLDLARVDSLYLCLLFAGIWLLVRDERHDVWAALCFAAAVLAKQTALIMVVALCAARFVTARGWTRVRCGLWVVAVLATATGLLEWLSHGWFLFYAYELPSNHDIVSALVLRFWRDDLFRDVPFALALALHQLTAPAPPRALVLRWAAALGFLGAAWTSRMHRGGWDNVLIPAFLFFAWMIGEAVGQARNAHSGQAGVVARAHGPVLLFAPVLVLLQFGFLWYRPTQYLPTAADRSAAQALVTRLATFDGPILSPHHVYLARLAGRPGGAHDMALIDVLTGHNRKVANALDADIRRTLRAKKYVAIVLDHDWWQQELGRAYQRTPAAPMTGPDALWMRTGLRIRPTSLYVPQVASPPIGPVQPRPKQK